MNDRRLAMLAALFGLLGWHGGARAQDAGVLEGEAAEAGDAGALQPAVAPEADVAEEATSTADVSAGAVPSGAVIAEEPAAPVAVEAPAQEPRVLYTGSHLPRVQLVPDGALVIDSPLTTEVRGREVLESLRQNGGIALADTSAALQQGGPGTTRLELRYQPTLFLLNGRRLVSAPYFGPNGADYVDLNQLPIALIDRVEITKGIAAGLYGDGAVGGVVNFITRRDFNGVEIDVGGQATDDFDQHETDVSLTFGAGDAKRGVTVMASYFNREPLAATDSDWIGSREDRVESLIGSPGSFQQIAGFDYPFPDPFCEIARRAGHSTGLEVRLRGYGPPETLQYLPPSVQQGFLTNNDVARGDGDGVVEAYETGTYCATDFTPAQDLILKEERLQAYATAWNALSDHTEVFGELGFYRSNNENQTAPSFPIIRLVPNAALRPIDAEAHPLAYVPIDHADQPVQERGFSAAEVAVGRRPNSQFIVGRVAGTYAGSNVNTRHVDVLRGVLGIGGDLAAIGDGVLDTWNWEVAGVYSRADAVSTANDVLMDKLVDALNACQKETGSDRTGFTPTTIKQRQEAGCFNPFYTSVINNRALDPLGVATGSAPNSNGFIASDTDAPGMPGYGAQDGGYICDPNDPNSPPCPEEFDRDGDGIFELAGTPNTAEVIDRMTGEQTTVRTTTLGTIDGTLLGDIVTFESGGLAFAAQTQLRHETLEVNHDAAYNERLYAFLFGAPDVDFVARNVAAASAELRLRLLDGLVELQPAARVEHFDDVGTAFNPLLGLALRPFAAMGDPPDALEWLLFRGHIGQASRAPSLHQLHGGQVSFEQVEWTGRTLFVPHFVGGNDELDFEKYTTVSGGMQWDFAGIHLAADAWWTTIDDLIASDNTQTLLHDCEQQRNTATPTRNLDCFEAVLLPGERTLDHLESTFDNLAEVDTTGVDGALSYTLDTKRRGLPDIGTFVVGAQGTFIHSYLIKSPRGLREYYRTGGELPVFNQDGTRNYDGIDAEYEAAGYRNLDNFAPPMPKLRFSAPVQWLSAGHVLGVTMRYIGGYNDDSEHTIERFLSRSADLNYAIAEGEPIPAWTVFDASYGYAFGDEHWKTKLTVGVINALDTAPPAVESPLGYEIGLHDPRGRVIYARATGTF